MPVSVTMPRLGESVSEGTVTRWLKKAGERVEVDEPLLEVSTDKVDTEIPSPVSGVLTEIKVQEDETVDVGVELAVIDDGAAGGGAAEAPAAQAPAAEPAAPAAPATTEADPEAAASPAEREELAAETAPAPEAPQAQAQVSTPEPSAAPPVPAAAPPADLSGNADAYVTPLVRKLASEHGVDLSNLAGTGV